MKLRLVVLGLLAIAAGTAFLAVPFDHTAKADQSSEPRGARYRFTLEPGETSRTIPIKSIDGRDILMTISSSSPEVGLGHGFDKGVSFAFSRQCSTTLHTVAPSPVPGSYSVTLTSRFFWDHSSVWQNEPNISEDYHNYPASTSDLQAYNSPYSQTVTFADGRFNFVWNLPWPNATSSGQHMWIQEDAWGNCSFFSS